MKEGDKVAIADESMPQFLKAANERNGTIVKIRHDGLICIRWDGLKSNQVWHPRHLKVLAQGEG